VLEELGLDRDPRRLLAVDWAPSNHEGDKLLFLFDRGGLGDDVAAIRVDEGEIERWAWVAPADLDDHTIDRIAERIRSTASRFALYLGHGHRIGS
jgi:8-oxo-dGTP pyrophosphatase MutT (NUDIX family)